MQIFAFEKNHLIRFIQIVLITHLMTTCTVFGHYSSFTGLNFIRFSVNRRKQTYKHLEAVLNFSQTFQVSEMTSPGHVNLSTLETDRNYMERQIFLARYSSFSITNRSKGIFLIKYLQSLVFFIRGHYQINFWSNLHLY